jgi:hypothetical protein
VNARRRNVHEKYVLGRDCRARNKTDFHTQTLQNKE